MPSLRPYQEIGRDFLAARRHALLADEMRVGKTPQAILAAEKIGAQQIIVVCPAIAVPQWKEEWRRWCKLDMPVIVSYDRLRIDAPKLLANKYDLAIVDECHFAKSVAAQRTRLVYGKGGLIHQAARMWMLSGTPAPKHAGELWPMLYAAGIVRMKYDEFLRHFCVLEPLSLRVLGTKERTIPELRALLAQIMLRRTRKEVAPEVPPIGFEFMQVEPANADLKLPSDLDGDALLAWIESHPVAEREDRIAVAKAKLPALTDEIVESFAGGLYAKTVVFGWHREPLIALRTVLAGHGISVELVTGDTSLADRTRIRHSFRYGPLQVVIANIIAAGTAIDLSSASHGYFLEMDWVPGNNVQAANRLVAVEKTEPVTFDVLTWPGSRDDAVQRALLRRVRELAKIF